jgi:hypothetical protein
MTTQDAYKLANGSSRASLWRTTATTALLLGAGALTIAAAPPPVQAPLTAPAKVQYLKQHMAKTSHWKPMFFVGAPTKSKTLRAHPLISSPGLTIPFWSTMITSPLDGHTYDVSMVGSSPYALHPSNTNVTYVPTVLRIHLDGFVLDPTAPSSCDAQSPSRRFFNSPLFRPQTFISNGVNVSASVPGGTQLISAFQRANFWNAVQGTSYGVTLIPSRLDPIVVDWFPTDPQDFIAGVPDNCGGVTPLAVVNINEFNDELLAIAATYAHSNQIPVTLGNDVAIYVGNNTNNCCVLGYHNAVPVPGGTQVYATGAYFDTNSVFGPNFADTTIWSHELAELTDDPFVQSISGIPGGTSNDLTPAWGHTGQVSGCQNNLEAGDPLTPSQVGNYPNFPVPGVGGFVYHQQDLPFHDWFYRTPSSSAGGKYSMKGIFTTVQGVCH